MPGRHDIDRYESRRSVVRAPNGIVATSQPLAAEVGAAAIRDGGNAFDAAVTAAAVLNVVEPHSTGIGGDVFALYHTDDGVGAMRSIGQAPGDATREDIVEAVGSDPPELPERGPLTVTPPGAAHGWERLIEDFGQQDLAAALAPAINYAGGGFPVTDVIASQWSVGEEVLTNDHARDVFLVDGRAPEPGEVVRNRPLAETFRKVAADGADVVYQGELADRIVSTIQSRGGYLSASDLRAHTSVYVDPITTTYGGVDVFELPAPNQGPIAIEALNIAAAVDAGGPADGTAESVHRYVEAFKRAFHDGHRYVTDPSAQPLPPLTSHEWASERAAGIGHEATTNVTYRSSGPSQAEDADTVLVTAADGEGNVVSLINSVFTAFGSGLAAADTGIILQSRGASFSLDEDHPNRFAPRKRPFHTLVPAVARFGPDDWAAFGVMGGYMQPQGHLQVLARLVDRNDSLQAALDRPRWRYRSDGTLAIEARVGDRLATELARRGHNVRVQPFDEFGGGQIVRCAGGVLSGATDPRKDGTVAGF